MKLLSLAGKLLAGAVLAAVAHGASAQKTQLTVYTALETDQLKAYQAGFEKANPNIEIVWVRDSTGIITAKLLAEKSNPKADVIMGVAATPMITSAFGAAFSARIFAVMMPVESRTHVISMSGCALLKPSW